MSASSKAKSISNISEMLIIDQKQDHQQQALKYLQQKKLVTSNSHSNITWINEEGQGIAIKEIRQLLTQSSYGAYNQQIQVFVLLHAQQASLPAQNALLKVLEEPPVDVKIILTTSQPQQLLPTINSRCKKQFLTNKDAQNEIKVDEDIAKIGQNILNKEFDYPQAFEVIEKYKKRDEAIILCRQLTNFLHEQIEKNHDNTQIATQALVFLLQAFADLNANQNAQLVLENAFFKIINI